MRAMAGIVRDLIATRDAGTYFADRAQGLSVRYDLGGQRPLIGCSAADSNCPTALVSVCCYGRVSVFWSTSGTMPGSGRSATDFAKGCDTSKPRSMTLWDSVRSSSGPAAWSRGHATADAIAGLSQQIAARTSDFVL